MAPNPPPNVITAPRAEVEEAWIMATLSGLRRVFGEPLPEALLRSYLNGALIAIREFQAGAGAFRAAPPASEPGSPQASAPGLRDDGKKAAPRRHRKRTLQQEARLVARNMRP